MVKTGIPKRDLHHKICNMKYEFRGDLDTALQWHINSNVGHLYATVLS